VALKTKQERKAVSIRFHMYFDASNEETNFIGIPLISLTA
jgi:hypothetical protein